MTDEQKAEIDSLSQEDMCRRVRFSPIGDPIFKEDTATYFRERLQELGGFTPEISKKIGWT